MKAFRLFILLCLSIAAHANEVPGGVFALGATKNDPAGQPLGYVLLSSQDTATLAGRRFGVHVKPAAANAAGEFSFQGMIQPVTEPAAASAILGRAERLGESRQEVEKTLRFLYRKAKHPGYLSLLTNPRQPGSPPWPDDPPQQGEPPVAEQAVMVVARAAQDPALALDLDLASQASPAIAMLRGRAWAGALPAAGQMVTVEIRLREGELDGPVVGRVELRAGVPLAMPAPGAPVQVPLRSADAHLGIGMRWASPVDLRRLSMLSSGFRLYRVDQKLVADMGLNPANLTLADLESLVIGMPAAAIRTSQVPIIIPKLFTETNVSDFNADGTTVFYLDRNQRCCGEATPRAFQPCEGFYYYTVACDLLGQPGALSSPGRGVACRTFVPMNPSGVDVEVDYTSTPAKVIVKWQPQTDGMTPPTKYEILRGVGKNDPRISRVLMVNDGEHLERGDPNLLVKCGELAANATTLRWVDQAPVIGAGETCWYAVRAVQEVGCAECPDLVSPPSAPAFVTIRRMHAPAPPVLCHQGTNFPFTVVAFDKQSTIMSRYPAVEHRVNIACGRETEDVTHMKLAVLVGGGATVVWERTVYFPPGKSLEDVEVSVVFTGASDKPSVRCTAYGADSSVSNTVTQTFELPTVAANVREKTSMPWLRFVAGNYSISSPPPPGSILRTVVVSTTTSNGTAIPAKGRGFSVVPFSFGAIPAPGPGEDTDAAVLIEVQGSNGSWQPAGGVRLRNNLAMIAREFDGPVRATLLKVRPPAGCDGSVHRGDTADGTRPPLTMGLCLTPGTKEYRIYRSINGGELSLIEQGDAVAGAVNGLAGFSDPNLPAGSARVEYYAQFVNGDGSASPMTALACPVIVITAPPVPVLNRLRPVFAENGSGNEMEVQWHCSATGVERFQIFVESGSGNLIQYLQPVPTVLSGTPGGPAGGPGAVTISGNFIHTLVPGNVGSQQMLNTRSYYTKRVGENAEGSTEMLGIGPNYKMRIPVNGAGQYKVWVKSIGLRGGVSAPSNALDFRWRNPVPETNVNEAPIPWPARELPPAINGNAFTNPVRVVRIPRSTLSMTVNGVAGTWRTYWPANAAADGVSENYLRGVMIGFGRPFNSKDYIAGGTAAAPRFSITSHDLQAGRRNANAYLTPVRDRPWDLTLPAVLYRRQIPSSTFPQPAGDVIQVSPLIESIASYRVGESESRIADPYVAVLGVPLAGGSDQLALAFCLLDTQPVIEGASYQYFLVRFDGEGEMRDVVDAGTTTIETQP
ncbi:hypothetical protein OKA04_18690 [Luteolibacter flavescens]|uniref:Ig-like domain-containing protein n=1 Tax=Luteolibacter flavescens TaxID=1859460 RepID=A0ABT3FU99_9BACT|nr:hypothetical protein [Luteolibacter flavescens]MCW1886774.1 hypothetical protein [Luteolibacter flavescens]